MAVIQPDGRFFRRHAYRARLPTTDRMLNHRLYVVEIDTEEFGTFHDLSVVMISPRALADEFLHRLYITDYGLSVRSETVVTKDSAMWRADPSRFFDYLHGRCNAARSCVRQPSDDDECLSLMVEGASDSAGDAVAAATHEPFDDVGKMYFDSIEIPAYRLTEIIEETLKRGFPRGPAAQEALPASPLPRLSY